MSTILTINMKEPKMRVTFSQPLYSISEIQLVDYDFPETYEVFETDQVIKTPDMSKTLLTVSQGGYSHKTMRTAIIMSNLGIVIHPTNEGYCISSKDANVVVSRELAKVLGIPSYLFAGKYYPISWPRYKYHVYCYISTFRIYPSCQIWSVSHPINYITLSVLDENGNEPKFGGVPFRINLKIIY